MEKQKNFIPPRVLLWILGTLIAIGISVIGYLGGITRANSRAIEKINTSLARVETDLSWVKEGIKDLNSKLDRVGCPSEEKSLNQKR